MIPTSLSEKMKIIALMRVKAAYSCVIWIDPKKPPVQLFPGRACNVEAQQNSCNCVHNVVHVCLQYGFDLGNDLLTFLVV